MNRIAWVACRLAVVLCFVVVSGCGGGGGYDETSPHEPALTQSLAGTWMGTVTVGVIDATSFGAESFVHVVVRGDAIRIEHVCPDGSGVIETRGEDDSAAWTGVLDCPVSEDVAPCGILRVTNGSVWLNADGGLSVAADGVSACGDGAAVRLTFSGVRPSL